MTVIKRFTQQVQRYPDWILLILAGILYTPMTFLGYGSDSDAENVVRIGQYFARTFDYLPSRKPGFFVHETATYFLNLMGGSLLSNLGTMLMALIALYIFIKILRKLNFSNVKLLTLIFLVHPFFWVNSTSTMDYVWAMGFFLLGFYLLMDQRYLGAGIALGLAIGSRFTTVIPVLGVIIYCFCIFNLKRKSIYLAALLTLFVTIVCYLPAMDFTEWHPLMLFSASVGDTSIWTPALRSGRFLYKNLMFWGIPALLWLVIMVIIIARKREFNNRPDNIGLIWLSTGTIIATELLFLAFPIEMDYLIILIPFVLFIVGLIFKTKPGLLIILFLLILSANFIWINPARPTTPNQTSGAIYGLWLERGYLLQDISARLAQLR